jgi:uncharacterized protein (TIGR03000 family)
MYSVVLMAALSANGPDAVAFGKHRGGCWGNGGCYGGCAGWSCRGCGGCYGGCGGCYGGGGCYGVAYGIYGGCSGCWGGSSSSCWGCYGGTACYGGAYGSCMGCWGHHHSGYGCYGGCWGSPVWYPGQALPYHESGNPMVAPQGSSDQRQPEGVNPPAANPQNPANPNPGAAPANPPAANPNRPSGAARLILEVPAGANLFVDDVAMAGRDTTRQFATPPLEPGQTYYYTVRVDATRDGRPVSETRRVLVRANEIVRETFTATDSVASR